MPVQCTCLTCGKTFFVAPNRIRSGRGKYCSKKCFYIANSKNLKGNQYAKGRGPNQTSFKKGLVPWNKGLKGIHLSPQTEFKPGRNNERLAPVGTVTIRKDKSGNLRRFIKLSNEPGNWEMFARVVWCDQHFSIPDGSVIHHVDRDILNDDIGNLRLMTRSEHLNEHRSEIRASSQEPC